ncbi:hypothetical protein SAMN05661091_3527 [Paenibacillus uliginis N3/975]|uniref:Uncharacterized protein n=1 Tax=Paenibacillus uliginis N3/975 TaxID=1313296 RepID=A0A1X7HJ69_9BACL|nr:hypothetical protein [Paenibacillus uliginis]SMF86854.1 hypothetical protein SAMN05661091_3527 [Paenibacillus uliginis N3/975]
MSIWLWILAVSVVLAVLVLVVNAKAKAGANMGFDIKRDKQGNVILFDTPGMRADAADSFDLTIEMEKRGHKMSNGMSWNDMIYSSSQRSSTLFLCFLRGSRNGFQN